LSLAISTTSARQTQQTQPLRMSLAFEHEILIFQVKNIFFLFPIQLHDTMDPIKLMSE